MKVVGDSYTAKSSARTPYKGKNFQ